MMALRICGLLDTVSGDLKDSMYIYIPGLGHKVT